MSYPRFQLARNFKRLSIGSLSPNVTAITEFATLAGGPGTGGYDITLAAQVGDVLEAHLGARMWDVAVYVGFDLYTMPAGVRTNPFGGGLSASLATSVGVPWWLAPNTAVRQPISGLAHRTVVSGDLDTGGVTVTCRLYFANSGAIARVVDSGQLFIRNIGPPDPN